MKRRPFVIFVAAAVLLGGVGLTWYTVSSGPQRVLGRAQAAIQSGDPEQAIGLLEELLASKPDLYQAHLLMGQARILLRDFDGARQEAKTVMDLRPKQATGNLFSAQIDRVEASNTLGKPAVMVNETSVGEALTLLDHGLKVVDEVEDRKPDQPGEIEEERGLLWRAKSRGFELRATLKRQGAGQAETAGEPDEAKSLRTEAQAATKQMNEARVEAIKYLKIAYEEGGGQPQAMLALLDVALAMGITEPVADIVADVRNSTDVKHPAIYSVVAQLIAHQDRYGLIHSPDASLEEALVIVEAGIKHFPDSFDLQAIAGRLELDRGNRDGALRYINDVLTRSPQHHGAMIERGRALMMSGNYGEAKALLQQFRSGGKADLRRSLYLAQALMRNGELETGQDTLADILELVPEDIAARLALAKSLSDAGDFEAADELLEAGSAAVPTSEDLIVARVALAMRRGRRGDIANILKQAFGRLPDSETAAEILTGLALTVGAHPAVRTELSTVAEAFGGGSVGPLARAGVLLADGKLDEAWSSIQSLAPAGNPRPGVLFTKARILAAKGDREGAAEAIDQAVEAGPDVDIIQHSAAQLFATIGWHGTALMTCEELLIQSTNQPAVQLLGSLQALFASKAARSAELIAEILPLPDEMQDEPLREAIAAYHSGEAAQCISACEKVKSVESLWLSALAAIQLGDLKDARQRCLAAIELDPARPELFQLCARTFHETNEREEGVSTFRGLAAKYPAYAKMGEALLALFAEDWAGAAKLFEEMINAGEDGLTRRTGFAVKLGLGTCYGTLGQTDQLKALVESLVESAEQQFGESIETADFLTRVNVPDRALGVLQKAELRIPKHHVAAWRRRQITDRYARLGQVERAVSIYARLIDALPLVPAYHTSKINLLRQAGRTEEAWQAVNQAIQFHPTEVGFHVAQARMLTENHRLKDAIEKFESLRSLSSSARDTANLGLRLLYARMGLHEEVLGQLGSSDEAEAGESDGIRLARVNAYLTMDRIDEALAECDKIPSTTLAYRNGRLAIAQRYAQQDNIDPALAILKALAEGDPPVPGAFREMLRVLQGADRHEEALALANGQLAKLAAGSTERVDWLGAKGQAALRLSRFDVARASWDEMVAIAPTNQVLAVQLAALSYAEGDSDRAKKILKTDSTKNFVGDLLRTVVFLSDDDLSAAKAALNGIGVEPMGPAYRQCAALLSIAADGLADTPVAHWQIPSIAEKLVAETAAWADEPAKRQLVRQAATCLLLSELQLPQAGVAFGQRVVVEAPDIPLGWWVMTTVYDRMGDSAKGLATVQTLVEKFADKVSARDSVVARLIESQQLDDAEKALATWTEAGGEPEASYAWSQGSYLLARDKPEDGVSWFEKCLKADPGFIPAKAKLVELLVAQSSSDPEARKRVIDLARQLVQGNQRNPGYGMMLGWALALNQVYDEAIVHLNAALAAMPQNATLHYRLGWAYEKHGQSKMAIRHYGQAVSYGLTDAAEAQAAKTALETLSKPADPKPTTAPTTQPAGASG